MPSILWQVAHLLPRHVVHSLLLLDGWCLVLLAVQSRDEVDVCGTWCIERFTHADVLNSDARDIVGVFSQSVNDYPETEAYD